MSPTKLPRCYFTVTIDGMKHGTVIFELCADICPKTCENFLSLCTGEKGRGGVYGKPLTYKGSTFHRVVRNFMIQGGDFTHGTGVGGESIYGGVFADENFILKHDQKFLLSMANRGSNTNGSQFFITTAVCPHLDNSHVVFGHVVEGESIVETIENITVDEEHKPYSDIRIIDCGVVPGFGPAIPPPDLSNPNAIPMLGPVLPPEVVQQVEEAPKEEKKKKKKKDDSNLDSSSSESSDSSDSDSSDSDSESDSDELTKKLKKKKKKLNNIKKKLNKLAKKKKLKKSRAKKLKRVEEKLKKIDSMLNGKMMESESEESDKEKLKNSFLYRSSQSPPKKKKRKEKKEDKVLDESFFARRGKITGALLAPVSHLHGGGSAEYSQTGPMDNITNIVNRNKSNVGPGLGGLEKAKKLGVPKVTVPPVGSKPPVIKDLVTEKKESSKDKKKKSKKRSESNLDQLMNVLIEESSSDSPSESSSASSSEEEKKKKKKKPSTTKKPSKRSPKKEIVKEKSVSKETTHSRKSKSRKKSRSRSKETRKKSKSRSRSRSSSTSPKRSRSYRHEKRSHSRSHRRDRRQSSSSSSSDSSRSSSGERYSGMKRAPRGRGNYRGYNSRYPPRLPFNNTRDPRDTRNSYNQSNRYRGGYHGYYNHHNSSSHHTSHHNNHHSKSHRSRSRSRSPKRHHSSSSKLSEKNFVPRTVRKVTEDQYKYVRKEEEGKLDKSPKFHYQDDVDERKEVKPSTGLRSKWSDDEDPVRITDDKDKVAITLEERLGKQLHQQTKKTNGVEKPSLEKPDEPILSEYNSPKLTFG